MIDENKIIADYVRDRCPQIIGGIDFFCYRMEKVFEQMAQQIVDNFRRGYGEAFKLEEDEDNVSSQS